MLIEESLLAEHQLAAHETSVEGPDLLLRIFFFFFSFKKKNEPSVEGPDLLLRHFLKNNPLKS